LSERFHGALGRSGLGCGENRQWVIGGRWAKKGVEIHQDLCGERGGARRMVDGQPGVIREDEWIGGFGFGTVLAAFRETPNPCPLAVFVVQNEHDVFLLHQNHRRS